MVIFARKPKQGIVVRRRTSPNRFRVWGPRLRDTIVEVSPENPLQVGDWIEVTTGDNEEFSEPLTDKVWRKIEPLYHTRVVNHVVFVDIHDIGLRPGANGEIVNVPFFGDCKCLLPPLKTAGSHNITIYESFFNWNVISIEQSPIRPDIDYFIILGVVVEDHLTNPYKKFVKCKYNPTGALGTILTSYDAGAKVGDWVKIWLSPDELTYCWVHEPRRGSFITKNFEVLSEPIYSTWIVSDELWITIPMDFDEKLKINGADRNCEFDDDILGNFEWNDKIKPTEKQYMVRICWKSDGKRFKAWNVQQMTEIRGLLLPNQEHFLGNISTFEEIQNQVYNSEPVPFRAIVTNKRGETLYVYILETKSTGKFCGKEKEPLQVGTVFDGFFRKNHEGEWICKDIIQKIGSLEVKKEEIGKNWSEKMLITVNNPDEDKLGEPFGFTHWMLGKVRDPEYSLLRHRLPVKVWVQMARFANDWVIVEVARDQF